MSCGCNKEPCECAPVWPPEPVDPTVCQTCLINPCSCDRLTEKFTQLKGDQIRDALIPDLTCVVDDIRDLYTVLGARPYSVTLVWTRWSGGSRDVGVEEVFKQCPLLPTPKVSDLSNLDKEVFSIGSEEVGGIRVSQISPRFNEDQLIGQETDGTPIPPDQNFYYEVEFFRADGANTRRRFAPSSAPNLDPTKFQWWIDLRRAWQDRTRDGDPNG